MGAGSALDSSLVAALYGATVDGAGLETAIEALARRFDCGSGTIVAFDPLIPSSQISLSVGSFDQSARELYDREFAAIDPAPPAFFGLPSGMVVATDRLFSKEFRSKAVVLHEFLRPLGVEETVGGTISSVDGRFAFLTIHRGNDRPSFDDGEIAALTTLMPHIAMASHVRRAFARLETRVGALAASIDGLAAGIAVVAADGSAVHVNRAARGIAGRADGLWFDGRGLPHARDREAEKKLDGLRRGVLGGGAGGILPIPRDDDKLPYAVLLVRLPAGTELIRGSEQEPSGVLILIHDPDTMIEFSPDVIAALFDLPPGAARLVASLAAGEDTQSYARRHGLSYDTVRYHLKTAFARTGVRSQPRLLQMVVRALSGLQRPK